MLHERSNWSIHTPLKFFKYLQISRFYYYIQLDSTIRNKSDNKQGNLVCNSLREMSIFS